MPAMSVSQNSTRRVISKLDVMVQAGREVEVFDVILIVVKQSAFTPWFHNMNVFIRNGQDPADRSTESVELNSDRQDQQIGLLFIAVVSTEWQLLPVLMCCT